MKVAVIGCGGWGKNLVRNFHSLNALHSICDLNENLAFQISKTYNVDSLKFQEILESSVEGVVISSPAKFHYDLSIQALKSKKHVFVEKPLSMNIPQANSMIKEAKINKRKLMVGHLLQYHPIFRKLLELKKSDRFGKVRLIYSNRLSFGKVRNEENVLWSFGPHDISMVLSLINSKVKNVRSFGSSILQKKILDESQIDIDFMNGARAKIKNSWISPFKEHKLTLIGDKAMAVFDDTKDWNEKLLIMDYKFSAKKNTLNLEANKKKFIKVPFSEPLKEECMHFLEIMKNKKENITDGFEGKKVVEILERASKALP